MGVTVGGFLTVIEASVLEDSVFEDIYCMPVFFSAVRNLLKERGKHTHTGD